MTVERGDLPAWPRVLVVVAHPDDESFGLGAVIDAFVRRGSAVTVLCFTRGEASTVHGVDGDLGVVRERELRDAADALGIDRISLLDFPDGALSDTSLDLLARHVSKLGREVAASGLLVFDDSGVTRHPDHRQATAAAVRAAPALDVPVLAWTLPDDVAGVLHDELGADFVGRPDDAIDVVLTVDRKRQRRAVSCHPSQAVPGSVLWRRLELSGQTECLRWLRFPAG